MTHRRTFLKAALAATAFARTGWSLAGSPAFLSAAQTADGAHVLCGLTNQAELVFQVPLPARGHAAAAHPTRPEAVGFARRPGQFAIVLDCVTGTQTARLDAPKGRHFYGHGCFSADGSRLFTTENDYGAGRGVIGIWDASNAYTRIAEHPSYGIGPHDIKRLPDGRLVVANGGIETHPDAGRSKLNIPTMRPNLAIITQGGDLVQRAELPPQLHKASIRHLAVSNDGLIGFAMQWQGEQSEHPPLAGVLRTGGAPELLRGGGPSLHEMRGYAGSIAVTRDGRLAITSPKGGLALVYDISTRSFAHSTKIEDVCGACAVDETFYFADGHGRLTWLDHGRTQKHQAAGLQWDNHLIALSA